MRVLIAPNAFKHSLTAKQAATAIERGLQAAYPEAQTRCFPIADGGDGTWELLNAYANGQSVNHWAHDPLGRQLKARYGWDEAHRTAYIGLAEASGLRLIKPEELDPFRATSFGTGELMRHALDLGATNIVVSVGGSATTDAGKGLLSALGIRFSRGRTGMTADTEHAHSRLPYCAFTVVCDVVTTLLGPTGTARVFGPQKGASESDIPVLEAALVEFAACARRFSGIDIATLKHGGAAGGAAAGMAAFLDATLLDGASFFLDKASFDTALIGCDLLITGEGKIDRQTAYGKAPFEAAKRAKQHGIKVIGLGGEIDPHESLDVFDQLIRINKSDNLEDSLTHTAINLEEAGRLIGLGISRA